MELIDNGPNGYGLYCSVTDDFIMVNATREQILEEVLRSCFEIENRRKGEVKIDYESMSKAVVSWIVAFDEPTPLEDAFQSMIESRGGINGDEIDYRIRYLRGTIASGQFKRL